MLCGQVAEIDARDLLQPEGIRRGKPAMTGDDPLAAVDEDGIRETEFTDAGGNLRYLFLGVSTGIPF
jgi:hypothetical protein